LGGEDLDEALREVIEAIRHGDVAVERGRVELGEEKDPIEPGVQAVRHRDVDETIFPTHRDGGPCAPVGGRGKAGAPGPSPGPVRGSPRSRLARRPSWRARGAETTADEACATVAGRSAPG